MTTLALEAYEALAPYYDAFTSDYAHDAWLGEVEQWARASGLRGNRVLDVGCGTGKSFEPLLARGYRVTACDLSPAMVERARERTPDVHVADMRALPWSGEFDLITCMDDGLNYLLTESDLDAALAGMARALRPGGIAVFDTNTVATYRHTFGDSFQVEHGDLRFSWRGAADAAFGPGALAEATLHVDDCGETSFSRHVERHWPIDALRDSCTRAGFARVYFRGQVSGGRLVGDPDEGRHVKVVCLAATARPGREESA